MGSLLRLALLAATGATIGGLEHTGRRLAICLAAAIGVGILIVGAIGCFAAAGWYALLPQLGPAWAALIIGLALALVAVIIWAVAERRGRRSALRGSGAGIAGLGLLDALPAQLAEIDIGRVLERNAGTIVLAAFAAGMFLNRRR
jgi:4-amino-4-deoxy-L-arabinose transferase-like glycosyltransferase